MFKKLISAGVLCIFVLASCSQSAPKTEKTSKITPKQVKEKGEGAACCVSKVPSRFTIVKNTDSISGKKAVSN